MLHKSYVSEVVDPLSDHLANWHGSPDHGSQHQLLDSAGFGHQHWITAACGVIETLTLDPMTGIFCPLVSCLLLPRLVSIPYPHIYDHRNSAKVYSTQQMESRY